MRIRWLYRASRDLDNVHAYIARDNPKAAVIVVVRILEAVARLKENPSLGRTGRVEGTRELIVVDTPFMVPYRVKAGWVEILRVFHQARKWPDAD